MRKTFIILAIIFIIFGVIFTILPLEKFGLLAATIALVLGLLAYKNSEINNTNFPKYLTIIALGTLFTAAYFAFLTNNEEIVIDQQFEQQKAESIKQDQKDLEDLEGL